MDTGFSCRDFWELCRALNFLIDLDSTTKLAKPLYGALCCEK